LLVVPEAVAPGWFGYSARLLSAADALLNEELGDPLDRGSRRSLQANSTLH